ncbi:class I SAM-dependent methyltransferase [Candidatus Beckwithbacteria bacterium]|nr:class I SAM-dependent methyltransferase [Candidatus Beckwithbacteria bacterium]
MLYDHVIRYNFARNYLKKIPRNNLKILDIACGSGYGCKILAQAQNVKQVVGVDIAKESIDYAKLHYSDKKNKFKKGDGLCLKERENYFDVIVSFETIEHLEKDMVFLQNLKKVLKKMVF